jgi:hypothetical protein
VTNLEYETLSDGSLRARLETGSVLAVKDSGGVRVYWLPDEGDAASIGPADPIRPSDFPSDPSLHQIIVWGIGRWGHPPGTA